MCTTIGEGQSRPWCPTSLDSNGVHSQGSRDWGYCDPRCAFIDSKLQENTGTTPRPGLRRGRPSRPTRRPIGNNNNKLFDSCIVNDKSTCLEEIPDIFLTVKPKVTTTTTPLPPTYTESNPDSLFGTWYEVIDVFRLSVTSIITIPHAGCQIQILRTASAA